MQSDIVQRLLDEHARNGGQGAYAWQSRELCGKAAAEIARLTEALRAAEEREKALRGKFLTIADDAGETYLAWVENGCDPADAIRVIGWVEDFSRRSSQEPSHEAS